MDDTNDSRESDTSNGGAPNEPRRGSPRSAAQRRTKQSTRRTGPRDTAPPRRWWEQPWLWVGLIVGSVAIALGVSFVVNTDPDDITPTGDTTAFCPAVKSYQDLKLDLSAKTTAADLDRVLALFQAVQTTSPPELQSTTDEVGAALAETVQGLKAMEGEPDSIERAAKVDSLVTTIGTQHEHASIRLGNYVRRACGFDIDAVGHGTGPTGTRTPGATGPPGSVVVSSVPPSR